MFGRAMNDDESSIVSTNWVGYYLRWVEDQSHSRILYHAFLSVLEFTLNVGTATSSESRVDGCTWATSSPPRPHCKLLQSIEVIPRWWFWILYFLWKHVPLTFLLQHLHPGLPQAVALLECSPLAWPQQDRRVVKGTSWSKWWCQASRDLKVEEEAISWPLPMIETNYMS